VYQRAGRGCGDPVGHGRLRTAQEIQHLAKAFDPGVRPQAGRDQRTAGDAEPRRVDRSGGEQACPVADELGPGRGQLARPTSCLS
jgi:hypothetical protein